MQNWEFSAKEKHRAGITIEIIFQTYNLGNHRLDFEWAGRCQGVAKLRRPEGALSPIHSNAESPKGTLWQILGSCTGYW